MENRAEEKKSLGANISEKAALIWAIADKLTGVYIPMSMARLFCL